MQISVGGGQVVRVPPERAELSLTATLDDSDRRTAVAQVTAAANRIAGELDALGRSGAVERHAMREEIEVGGQLQLRFVTIGDR